MKKHAFSVVIIIVLLCCIGFMLSFSFVRDGLMNKLVVMQIDLFQDRHPSHNYSLSWVKRSVYRPQNIITLPFEWEIHCDDHKMTQEEQLRSFARGTMRFEYPKFQSLREGEGFMIEFLSGQKTFAPYAFLYGDDMIEMAPTIQMREEKFVLMPEQEEENNFLHSYPCVAYIKGNSINPHVDTKCTQVMVGDGERHLALHFPAKTGTVLKLSMLSGYYAK